jgi:chromosome segregation ATPase
MHPHSWKAEYLRLSQDLNTAQSELALSRRMADESSGSEMARLEAQVAEYRCQIDALQQTQQTLVAELDQMRTSNAAIQVFFSPVSVHVSYMSSSCIEIK